MYTQAYIGSFYWARTSKPITWRPYHLFEANKGFNKKGKEVFCLSDQYSLIKQSAFNGIGHHCSKDLNLIDFQLSLIEPIISALLLFEFSDNLISCFCFH